MHWSYKTAHEILEKYPDLQEYTVASGISPSGSVHIGNYREFITNYYVAKALQNLGKKVKMIFSWDEYDRFRKVPKNIAERTSGFEKYIGAPYVDVPDPLDKYSSYAERFELEFEQALEELQMNEIPLQFVYQAKEYRSGRYNDKIIHALKNRKKIYDIIQSFKTQGEDEGERENYYPISVYCPDCKLDSTKVLSCSLDCNEIEYQCACGAKHKTAIKTANNIKLVWKVDWPMRWQAENIVFEAAGIDHHSEGGSFDVGSRIAQEIFGIEPPMSCCYAWVGIKGLGGMHSSSGNAITPTQLMRIYEPEMLRWLYAKYDAVDAFDFGFDETIVRHYAEFDKGVKNYFEGLLTEDYDKTVYDLCLFKDTAARNKTSFSTLTTIAPLAEFNENLIKTMLQKAGIEYTHDSAERVEKVQYWLENYQSEKIYKLRDFFNDNFFRTLDMTQRTALEKLHDFLSSSNRSERQIQDYLYELINDPKLTKKENILAQQRYFKIFYNMLFGRDDGPRLYLYLAAAPKEKYLPLLYN